jgi:hypothetical protein
MLRTMALTAVPAALTAALVGPAAHASPSDAEHLSDAVVTTTDASLTLSPTVKAVRKGAKVTLTITVDTGGHPVNALQAYLTFPDAQLDCTSFSLGATFANLAAKSCNGTTAAIAGSVAPGAPAFTGTAVFARVTFTTRSAGKALVSFDRSRTLVAAASTNTDVLGTSNTATITVKR